MNYGETAGKHETFTTGNALLKADEQYLNGYPSYSAGRQ
jgi:hypothetical protein